MANTTWVNPQVALSEAVTAAKLGQRNLARKLLREIVERDPRNESAWLWIAALSEDRQQAFQALSRVLEINPNNQQALNALALARLQESAPRRKAPPRENPGNDKEERAGGDKSLAAPAAHPEAPVETHPPAWQCPLCDAGAPQRQRRCPRCGALTEIASLEAYAENKSANEDALFEAIQRFQARIARKDNFADRLHLALALLNLNRSAEALTHLKRAAELNPDEPGVAQLVESLASRRLVLAVDDSLTVRKIVSITLERRGYRVLTAADGMQALARLNEEVPDLVLLDITMPRMDGYQVCKVIKQNPFTRRIPVVMLSGKDGFFDKVKGRLAGATDYITKPFREATLFEVVEKYIEAR